MLDLGCGIMQATTDIRGTPGNEGNLNCRTILGVDVFSKYLDQIKFEYPTLNIEITNTDIFVDQSYDVVICLDVLEHLTTKREAVKLLREMKRISRKCVITHTPSSFHSNDEHVHESWGLGGNKYQEHHILLSQDDFRKCGYETSLTEIDNNILAIYRHVSPPSRPISWKRRLKRVLYRALPRFAYNQLFSLWIKRL